MDTRSAKSPAGPGLRDQMVSARFAACSRREGTDKNWFPEPPGI